MAGIGNGEGRKPALVVRARWEPGHRGDDRRLVRTLAGIVYRQITRDIYSMPPVALPYCGPESSPSRREGTETTGDPHE